MVAINTRSLVRISVSGAGVGGDEGSTSPELTDDGRYVVFSSFATNLVPGDTSIRLDIFLRDTETGSTFLLSSTPTGAYADESSFKPSISANGRFVVFESDAADLIDDDANGVRDVFVRDVQSGTVTRISETAGGGEGLLNSNDAQISADGRFAVFTSESDTFVSGDNNAEDDVFRKDLLTGDLIRVSLSTTGAEGIGGSSIEASLSADGRFITFTSFAPNLVFGDTNGVLDIFQRDVALGTTTRVSVSTAEGQASDGSVDASSSADGRYVVFTSAADDLVAGSGSAPFGIFLRNLAAGTTTLISVSSSEAAADAESTDADVSDDGRYVVFESNATNLVADDTNGTSDVFLRDVVAGTTTRLSVGMGGLQAAGSSRNAHITGDGRFVVFESGAGNLVAGDANGAIDVFRVSLFASNDADFLIGSDVGDSINGLAGADIIRGGLGADTLDGGLGGDTLEGGLGNDVYRVNTPGDLVVEAEGAGVDNVVSTVSYMLAEGEEVETLQLSVTTGATALNLTGNAFSNTLRGNEGANTLNGAGGADALYGLGGADLYVVDDAADQVFEVAAGGADTVITSVTYTLPAAAVVEKLTVSASAGAAVIGLSGNAFVNALRGHAASNVLDGRAGSDSLTGLGGNDTFAFTTALGVSNVDTISDFGTAAGNNDSIRLENAVFTGLTTTGALSSAAFAANAAGAASTTTHRIVYDTTDGRLLYDEDGSGAGAAVQFATLTGAPALTSGDFVVV